MAARLKVKGYQGLKHCLAFLLLSLLLLKAPFSSWGLALYRSWNQGCSQCQSLCSQFLHQSFTHSSTEQRWLCQRHSSEHHGYRPHLWAADLLLLIFLPKEEGLRAWSGDGEHPGRGPESQVCAYLCCGDSFSPSLRPRLRLPAPAPDPVNHGPGMGYNNWQLLFESQNWSGWEGSAGLLCWAD